MARKSRYNKKLFVPRIATSTTVGALANNAAVGTALADTLVSDNLLLSIKCVHSLRNMTAAEGPVSVGVCIDDYTDAEIAEAILAQGAWDQSDREIQELARRRVRIIGIFPVDYADMVLNDGRPLKTKLNWKMFEGETLKFFVFNNSGAVLTTGGIYNVLGNAYMVNI